MTAPVAAPGDGFATVAARVAALERRLEVVSTGRAFSSTLARLSSAPATAPSALVTETGVGGWAAGGVKTSTRTRGDDVVTDARTYLGVPYVYAGTSRDGIDCSGLVQRVYGDLGIDLPRLSWEQAKQGTAVASLADARPGDIVAFGTPVHHVGIYAGDGKMIAAPQPGEVVKLQDVYETPSTIRRILPDTGVAASPTGVSGLSPAVAARAAQFGAAESRYGLPSGLLSAVAQAESSGNIDARSPAGAIGLMQLMPATAASLGVNPLDPAQAIDGAARLLRGHLQRFGSVPLALAAYNAGGGAVERFGGIPPYPETQNYVRRITAMLGIPVG